MASSQKFLIDSLEIECFRAYNSAHSFTFKEPLTIFYGKNGNGKSSTLYAIEWCLFGKVEFLPSLEGKARDEVINQFNPKNVARVKMVLKNGKEKVIVERTKALGKASTDFSIAADGEEYEGEEAENKFFLIFGMTIDDFIRSIYLHQEAIRALLTDDPAQRNDAFDRLFGLEVLRNIVSGIPMKQVAETIEKLNEKKEKTSGRLSGGIQVCQQQLERLEEKAADTGINQNEVNIDQARKRSTAIKNGVKSMCDDYSLEVQEITVPEDLPDFSSFESKVKKSLKEIEQQSIGDGKMTGIKYQKRTVEDLLHTITKKEEPIGKLNQQVGEITLVEGDTAAIKSKIAAIIKRIEEENKQRDALDTNSKLIGDAIATLKTLTKPLCPVCSQKIDVNQVLTDLEIRAETAAAGQIQTINENLSRLTAEKARLDEISEKLGRLNQALEEEETTQYTAIEQLARALEIAVDKKAVMAAAKEKISELTAETERLEKAEIERAQRIQTLRDQLEEVGIIIDILNKKDEIGKLTDVFEDDSSQMDGISETIVRLQSFQDQLARIVAATGRVQTTLASEIITESQKDIEGFYAKLCMHKHYDKMKIDVETKTARTGIVKNSYAIKAFSTKGKHQTHIASRFSTGQMNCVALSIFFALTKALPIKLGFMMLDDPSQSLDKDHKSALAEIVASLSSQRQILISTQDDEFKSMLQQKAKSGKFYEFVGIDISGPKFN